MATIQITARELRETDVIVLNPAATTAHDVREEKLAIARQRYGLTYTALRVVDGEPEGRQRGALRYADSVWVQR